MAKKYYAVRKGKKTGIFTTWSECEKQVRGFSGAEYKSFGSLKEAEDFMNIGNLSRPKVASQSAVQSSTPSKLVLDETHAIAYVDGSYNKHTKEFSYGAVIFYQEYEYQFGDKSDNVELASMHNVAGELKGSMVAMQFALKNNIPNITIHHDYEGIAKWCTGVWKANKEGTQAYKAFYEEIKSQLHVDFVKVKGHSGDKYNDLADQLANEAMRSGKFARKLPNSYEN